jgi:hypothetical protein
MIGKAIMVQGEWLSSRLSIRLATQADLDKPASRDARMAALSQKRPWPIMNEFVRFQP